MCGACQMYAEIQKSLSCKKHHLEDREQQIKQRIENQKSLFKIPKITVESVGYNGEIIDYSIGAFSENINITENSTKTLSAKSTSAEKETIRASSSAFVRKLRKKMEDGFCSLVASHSTVGMMELSGKSSKNIRASV